jgi:Leucine-rich repeat (LRR) protein
LNVSGDTALDTLFCNENKLPNDSLSVSGLSKLRDLRCYNNVLTSLRVDGLLNLTYLDCKNNRSSSQALNELFTSLNSTSERPKKIYIVGNPGTAGCNVNIATGKGWTVDYSPPPTEEKPPSGGTPAKTGVAHVPLYPVPGYLGLFRGLIMNPGLKYRIAKVVNCQSDAPLNDLGYIGLPIKDRVNLAGGGTTYAFNKPILTTGIIWEFWLPVPPGWAPTGKVAFIDVHWEEVR